MSVRSEPPELELADRPASASVAQHLCTLFACMAVAFVTVGLSVVQYPGFSIVDEMTHVDYAYRLSSGELVRRGDRLSPKILEELACRGYQTDGPDLPDCDAAPDPDDFPAAGYNYNSFHPPLYYAIEALGASTIQAVAPVESYVTAARLVGVGWLGGGMFVSWLLFLELAVGVMTSRLMALALGLLPVVVNFSSIVNNDAAALLAGAAIALTVVRYLRGRGPLWLVVAAVVGAALLKSVFLCAGLLAAVLVLDDAWRRHRVGRRPWRSAIALVVAIPLIFGAVQVGWKTVQRERTSDDSYSNPLADTAGRPSEGVPVLDLLEESTAFVPATRRALPTPQADSPMVEPWLDLSNLLIAGAPLCMWLVIRDDRFRRRFAGAVFASLVLGALSVMVVFYIQSGSIKGGLNPRYGLALLPANVACVAMLIDQSRVGRLASAAAVTAAGAILVGHIVGS